MTTRADTVHVLGGHVATANSSNAVTAGKITAQNTYKYDPQVHAVNKFVSQGNSKLLSQTFQVKPRKTANPGDTCPIMMLKPRNTDGEHSGGRFPSQRMSQTQDMGQYSQGRNVQNQRRSNSSALRESGGQTIDMSRYRGNLYKQTLPPNWSKNNLSEAKMRYANITEEARQKINSSGLSSASISPLKQVEQNERNSKMGATNFVGKTVTNFQSVRYGDNGGLNPVSPEKRGLPLHHTTETVKPSNADIWNRPSFQSAKPGLELDIADRTVSVFAPKKIVSDNDVSRQTFKKYSAFKNEFSDSASKADYKHFLDRVVQDKRCYDSNISDSLNYQKKFLAYKRKELAQRAAALHGNSQQDQIHKHVVDQGLMKVEMEKNAVIRVQPDQYNYRSPQKYTPISTYYKDLQHNRVFSMDGKMQLLRPNIR